MSGIEVAGLVLGSLPLIISALEHYESSLDRALAFFKWKGELDKAMRELWIQHSSYEMTLRSLLVGVVEDGDLEEMLVQPHSPLWKRPEVTDGLQYKLGAAYRVYEYTVLEMGGYMKTLASHLDIAGAKPTTADSLEAMLQANRRLSGSRNGPVKFEFKRRLKLTMKRGDIRQLLKQIKDCNDRLDCFIEKAESFDQSASQQAPGTRRKPTLSMPLQQIRNHAIRLHQVLSKALNCNVHSSHQAHLLLEHRMVHKGRKHALQVRSRGAGQEADDACFTLSFNGTEHLGGPPWYIAEIRIREEPRTAGSVKFNVSPPTTSPCPPDPISHGDPLEMKAIQDICSNFQSSTKPQGHHRHLGFYLNTPSPDQVRSSILRGTYQPTEQRPICWGHDFVSLGDILSSQRQSLSEEDRYLLAITLAASFLQLHQTPWIGDRWGECAILFYEETPAVDEAASASRGTPRQNKRIDIRHPFVAKTYHSADTAASAMPPAPATIFSNTGLDSSTNVDNTNLLALGKMLLHIRLGIQRVQDLTRPEDLGPGGVPNEATDLQVLKRWIVQEKGNLSFAFRGTITHCMKCFADPGIDLLDLDFLQSVIESVVAPLLVELHYLQDGF